MKNIAKIVLVVSALALVVDLLVFRGGEVWCCIIADLMFMSTLSLVLSWMSDIAGTISWLVVASTAVFIAVTVLAVLWDGCSPSDKLCITSLLYSALLAIVSLPGIKGRCKSVVAGHTSSTGWSGEPGSPVDDDQLSQSFGMPDPALNDTDKKMLALYTRVVEYMEKNEPYLDDTLDLESLSRSLFTNKVYLSRTVNTYSGKNFRQFVNSYRIDYAISLMQKDPHLRIEEVAIMSGFHTAVSFNMAFHLFKGENPSDWLKRYRDALK